MNSENCTPVAQSPSLAENTQNNPLPDGRGSEKPPAPLERDGKGRFARGNYGGPGNPHARQTAALRKAAADAITPDEMRQLFRHMYALALKDNVQAAKFVCDYTYGKPSPGQKQDPDRVDMHEWEGYKQTTQMMGEAQGIMRTPEPDYPLDLVRLARPPLTETMRQVTAHALEHPEEIEKQKQEEARKMQEESDRQWKMLNEPPTAAVLANSPLANGGNGPAVPSANGDNGQARPSANGPNGGSRKPRSGRQPSANGDNGGGRPSTNGDNGQVHPSANGDNGPPLEARALIAALASRMGLLPPA